MSMSFIEGKATIHVLDPGDGLWSLGVVATVSINMQNVMVDFLRSCPSLASRLRPTTFIRVKEDLDDGTLFIDYPAECPTIYMGFIELNYRKGILEYVETLLVEVDENGRETA